MAGVGGRTCRSGTSRTVDDEEASFESAVSSIEMIGLNDTRESTLESSASFRSSFTTDLPRNRSSQPLDLFPTDIVLLHQPDHPIIPVPQIFHRRIDPGGFVLPRLLFDLCQSISYEME